MEGWKDVFRIWIQTPFLWASFSWPPLPLPQARPDLSLLSSWLFPPSISPASLWRLFAPWGMIHAGSLCISIGAHRYRYSDLAWINRRIQCQPCAWPTTGSGQCVLSALCSSGPSTPSSVPKKSPFSTGAPTRNHITAFFQNDFEIFPPETFLWGRRKLCLLLRNEPWHFSQLSLWLFQEGPLSGPIKRVWTKIYASKKKKEKNRGNIIKWTLVFSGWWANVRDPSPYFSIILKFPLLNMRCIYNNKTALFKRERLSWSICNDTWVNLRLHFIIGIHTFIGFPNGSARKEPTCQCRRRRFLGWEDPLEKERQPTPVFLPGKSHGQRSLVGYSPSGHKELDTTACTCIGQDRYTLLSDTKWPLVNLPPKSCTKYLPVWGRSESESVSCSAVSDSL